MGEWWPDGDRALPTVTGDVLGWRERGEIGVYDGDDECVGEPCEWI